MAGGRGKINEHPNAGKGNFSANPENINRKGRPVKNYKEHISEIKSKGYQAPTHAEYYEMVSLLLSMTEDDLKEFATDEDRPYWIRCLIVDMNNKQTRQRFMEDLRDWLYGKAKQEIKAEVKTENRYSIEYIPDDLLMRLADQMQEAEFTKEMEAKQKSEE